MALRVIRPGDRARHQGEEKEAAGSAGVLGKGPLLQAGVRTGTGAGLPLPLQLVGCLPHTLPEGRGRVTGISLKQDVHPIPVTLQSCKVGACLLLPQPWVMSSVAWLRKVGRALLPFPLPAFLFPKAPGPGFRTLSASMPTHLCR